MRKKLIKDYLELGLTRNVYWDDINFPENTHTPSFWKCKVCGYRWKVSYQDIRNKHGCPKCAIKNKVNSSWKVEKDYLKLGLLLSIYWDDIKLPKNTQTKSFWKCKICGYRWKSLYNTIQSGYGCPKCAEKSRKEKMSGENHPNWNPNLTEEERQIRRKYPEYTKWTKAVYERDNYTCQICGDKKGNNLNAHHLEAYNSNKELRTTVSNGITLCEKCHKNFHHNYGYGNNTKEQFIEFKNQIRDSVSYIK